MCGFAGEFLLRPGRADVDLARRMAERLTHRGPDEAGEFISTDGRCAIGFRRLAVIDRDRSHQPMSSPDGRVTVAFNGEVYNFADIRRRLGREGEAFRTAGDTEVLLPLYRRHGPAMTAELDGMFAFAVYDAAGPTLLLARDRLGQKPLWYAPLADRIVFASEPKALLAHPGVEATTDADALTYYATVGYIPAPHTAWRGIRKLPPAHTLQAGDTIAPPARYWQPAVSPLIALPEELPALVRDALAGSVEARMVADVPLGALLSGGVDSSIVTALMCASAGRTGGVRTFSAGFAQADYDERPAARAVAEHCGAEHTELLIEPHPDADTLDRLVAMYDEPFADSSALPTYLICQAAREHVTVALAGDGGDEAFAGYDRYRAMHLADGLAPGGYFACRVAAAAVRPFAPVNERSGRRRFVRFVDGLNLPPAEQYLSYRCLFPPADLPRLFTDDFAAETDVDAPRRWFCELYEDGDFDDELTRAQHHDLMTYLPDDLLVKTDIASMASSLELRAPMLAAPVVNLGLSLPASLKVSRRRGKVILARAFGDMLPREVFTRPKRGFGVPLGDWLRGPLRDVMTDTLLDRGFLDAGIVRKEAVAGLINDHVAGVDDHSHRLWALLVLARWLARPSS